MKNQRIELFRKMLPGLLPLFVFIVIDEIWGTRVGLVAALIIGVVELIWIGIRDKRFDSFVFFDTVLLLLLGGVSIVLDNDIFFKLKPGLVELILCAILAFSAFSKVNIVALMSKRYMGDVVMNAGQVSKMRSMMQLLFFVFLFHTILVFFSAFYMSDRAWAFISGGLFYILFGCVFVYEFLKQKMTQNKLAKEEQLPLVTEEGQVIGKSARSLCHNGQKLLHPVVHLHVLNEANDIFLQKRPMDKLIQPGKWDTAVGGHISFGEELKDSLHREAWEEIGLKNFNAKFLKKYVWESSVEKELVYIFVTHDYQSIHLHSDEVEEGKFWTKKQILDNIGKEIFTPNFENEFQLLFNDNS